MLRQRSPKRLRTLATLSVLAVLISGLTLASPAPAQAADARDFNAGNIISDSLFYDGNAMTAVEVQAFLNQRVPRCTIGDPGRTAGMQWGNTTIATKCLRDYSMATITRPANPYCSAYVGRSSETAAEIIAKVAQACGISQRVLLITLEKEQSLVTDSWPTVRQIDVATGYACPDSGPNWSANCNPEYYGFQNQVYYAAWQLKVYRAFPNSYNYKPFQWNTIQYSPNPACGTSQVYIENWATAALYIYTPYRPNQAALNAQWGTGDGCSSYGNRNFYMLYATWFGFGVNEGISQIDARWNSNQWLGSPTSEHNRIEANGGGYVRAYENGAVAWSRSNGAFIISGDFRAEFNARGGLSGSLGWPTSDVNQIGAIGRVQGFSGGALTHRSGQGFTAISGSIRTHYNAQALGLTGPLGWPTSEITCTQSPQICSQDYEYGSIRSTAGKTELVIAAIEAEAGNQPSLGGATTQPNPFRVNGGGFAKAYENGVVLWSASSGAFTLSGAIRTAYGSTGGLNGALGWPVQNAQCIDGSTCSQEFQNGLIFASTSQVAIMSKTIGAAYLEALQTGRPLGSSTTGTVNMALGIVQAFENGAIAESPRTGAYVIAAPIRAPFNAAGGLGGSLGWPLANAAEYSSPLGTGGFLQKFEGGSVASSSKGAFVLEGGIQDYFSNVGGPASAFGWPVSTLNYLSAGGGGTVQAFEGGALTRPNGSTTTIGIRGEIRNVFAGAGGLGGLPGWPTTEERNEAANGGGLIQGFQNAAIASSPQGTYIISGEIRRYFNEQGGLTGSLGWPTGPMNCTSEYCSQTFQGGTLGWSAAQGGHRLDTPN